MGGFYQFSLDVDHGFVPIVKGIEIVEQERRRRTSKRFKYVGKGILECLSCQFVYGAREV